MKRVVGSKLLFTLILLCVAIISCTSSPTEPVEKRITKIYSLNSVGDTITHYCIKYADYNSAINFNNTLSDFFSTWGLSLSAGSECNSLVLSYNYDLNFFDTKLDRLLYKIPAPTSDYDMGDIFILENWMTPISTTQSILSVKNKLFLIDHRYNVIGRKIYESNALIRIVETSPDNKWIYLITEQGQWGGHQLLNRVHLKLGFSFLLDEFIGGRETDDYPTYRRLFIGNNVVVCSDGLKWRKYAVNTNKFLEEGYFPEYKSFTGAVRLNNSEDYVFIENGKFVLFDLNTCTVEEYYDVGYDFVYRGYQIVNKGIYAFIQKKDTDMYEIINLSTRESTATFTNPGAFSFAVFEE